MTNGHFDFELEGVKYSLHFGNIAVEQFMKLSLENIENNVTGKFKSLTDAMFCGLYNSALIEGRNMPKYGEAAELFDTLYGSDNKLILKEIEDCFVNSRATVKQLELIKPKSEPDEKKKKRTGTQSKPMLTEL